MNRGICTPACNTPSRWLCSRTEPRAIQAPGRIPGRGWAGLRSSHGRCWKKSVHAVLDASRTKKSWGVRGWDDLAGGNAAKACASEQTKACETELQLSWAWTGEAWKVPGAQGKAVRRLAGQDGQPACYSGHPRPAKARERPSGFRRPSTPRRQRLLSSLFGLHLPVGAMSCACTMLCACWCWCCKSANGMR